MCLHRISLHRTAAKVRLQAGATPRPSAMCIPTPRLSLIHISFTGKSNDEITAEFEGKGYGDFKMAVAEVTADALAPVQAEYNRILADKVYVDEVLKSGAERASRLANRTVSKVYRKVGLLQLDK